LPSDIEHGQRVTYQYWGCRCDLCAAANTEYDRKRREENPALREGDRAREKRWRERHPERSAANTARWRERNPEKVREQQKVRTERYRLRKYELTGDEYEAMVAAQNGVCAICGDKPETRLVIDHCHTTGLVRGLLCGSCNLGVGCFKDDVERLKKAIEYLEKFE
jgi:hypothetical protein